MTTGIARQSRTQRPPIPTTSPNPHDAVMKGSPAFKADILKGDVLKRIGGIEIYDVNNFLKAVDGYAGQNVQITFFRNGREIQKEVQLNNKTK